MNIIEFLGYITTPYANKANVFVAVVLWCWYLSDWNLRKSRIVEKMVAAFPVWVKDRTVRLKIEIENYEFTKIYINMCV